MYGTAVLRLHRRSGVLAVPVQAVAGHGGAASVMVVDANRQLEERKIETGIETPNMIEVLSGLKESDLVAIGSRSRLKAGIAVEPKLVASSSLSEH
jgi:multidrug efflux pump subunit AcrA (membrane-fusion protein)